jgi:hypothetical protein
MKTIVIDSSGGVVQQIYGDADIRVVLVDWDRVEDGGEEIGVVYPVVPMAAMGDEVAAQVASALQAESTPPT